MSPWGKDKEDQKQLPKVRSQCAILVSNLTRQKLEVQCKLFSLHYLLELDMLIVSTSTTKHKLTTKVSNKIYFNKNIFFIVLSIIAFILLRSTKLSKRSLSKLCRDKRIKEVQTAKPPTNSHLINL